MKRAPIISVGLALILVVGLFAFPSNAAESASTLPDGSNKGPRVASYDASVMASDAAGEAACSTLIEEGWSLAHPADLLVPRRLEGEVVAGHPPYGDFYFNHDTEDYNFFVVPDNQNVLASDEDQNYEYLLGYGNFHNGVEEELGRVEVEWEYGAHSWNDAADSGYYGFPDWAWPNLGDRVVTEGFWIFDCGHTPFRTEIHPPWFVATIRNWEQSTQARGSDRTGSAMALGADDKDFSPVTVADVFISSFGGEAVDNIFDDSDFLGREDWWMPVNNRDYDFSIPAPPKPSPDAELVFRILGPPSDYMWPPGHVGPAFDTSDMFPYERDGRTFVGVHIPMTEVPDADFMVFAKTLVVGWDVPEPDAKHFRISVDRWNVYDDLEGASESEYSAWVASGDQHRFVKVSDGSPEDDDERVFNCDSDGNYMPYCEPDEDENLWAEIWNVGAYPMDVYIVDEPLVVVFQVKDDEAPLGNDDGGFASQAFVEADNWGVGTHFLRQNDMTFAGEHPEDYDCDGPGGACYEVTYTIERILTPTAMTVIEPAIQYAQDPNEFSAKVFTPGSPDTPRRRLPVEIELSDGTNAQTVSGITNDGGIATSTDLLTLPAGDYTDVSAFHGNGLLEGSSDSEAVTILRDFTSSTLTMDDEISWGKNEHIEVVLLEPNEGQSEPPLPIADRLLTVTLTGHTETRSYSVGPTDSNGRATIDPVIDLPPGNYEAVACFEQDPWFRDSCSTPQIVKVVLGFGAYATGGPVEFGGGSNTVLGDLHSEGEIRVGGNSHVLSAAPGERLEYVTKLDDKSTGSAYNAFQVPGFGMVPEYLRSTYCDAGPTLMGIPVTTIVGDLTLRNDEVVNGIYCVTGNIKIQSRVTGSAVLLATGTITTAGGNQNIVTADPTGADLLMHAQSVSKKAIALAPDNAAFQGAVVAAGGIEISSRLSLLDTGIVGRQVSVSGSGNIIKAADAADPSAPPPPMADAPLLIPIIEGPAPDPAMPAFFIPAAPSGDEGWLAPHSFTRRP